MTSHGFPPPDTVFINPNVRPPGATPSLFDRITTALSLPSPWPSKQSDDRDNTIPFKSFSGFDLNKHPTNQQLQCHIFKLPLEIRLLIYEQIIKAWAPGDGFHILEARNVRYMPKFDKGLSFVPCDAPLAATNSPLGSKISHFHSWHLHDDPRIAYREPCESPTAYGWATNRLAILLNCRRIYTEFTEVLYSVKTFDLVGFEPAHRFLTTTAPQSLDKIQTLSLTSIQVPAFYTSQQVPAQISDDPSSRNAFLKKARYAEVQWMEICSRLGTMSNLKSLRIKIDHSVHMVLEGAFLRPVMAIDVKGGSFMAEVPFNFRVGTPHSADITGETDKIPFKIERGASLSPANNSNVEARPSIWMVNVESEEGAPVVACKEYCSCNARPNPIRRA